MTRVFSLKSAKMRFEKKKYFFADSDSAQRADSESGKNFPIFFWFSWLYDEIMSHNIHSNFTLLNQKVKGAVNSILRNREKWKKKMKFPVFSGYY